MSENKLRQGSNEAKLVGLVYDTSKLEVKEFNDKKTGKSYNAISGDIAIKVEDNIYYASVFQKEFNEKDGKKTENKGYKAWTTVIEEYKTVVRDGEENADKVALNNARLTKNEYGTADGTLVSNTRVNANFITRVNADNFTPEATFVLELYVTGQRKETVKDEDGDEVETGNLFVTGYSPDYNGNVLPFEIYVEGDDKVDYVESNYVKGSTVKVHGDIIQKKETITKEVKATGFGKPKVDTYTKSTTLYSVEGGNDPDDYADSDDTEVAESNRKFDSKQIKAAIKTREEALEKLLEDAKSRVAGGNKPKQTEKKKGGFGTKAPVNDNQVDISDEDLPF